MALLASCDRSARPEAKTQSFEVRGIVRGFAPDRSTIEIEHENIPDFMPSMTMAFTLRDPKAIANLAADVAIKFRLVVGKTASWIDQIERIDPASVQLPARIAAAPAGGANFGRVRVGDMMPPFELNDQDGHLITLETFHGRPFLLTFIFTRCPIPNFCPLMARNFSELQNAIKSGSGRLAGTRLLSISFDPEHDTPAVLKARAEAEEADPMIWTFATGAPAQIAGLTSSFSVLVQPERGSIAHALATALIDREGRIVEIWRGNGWKVEQVLAALKK